MRTIQQNQQQKKINNTAHNNAITLHAANEYLID